MHPITNYYDNSRASRHGKSDYSNGCRRVLRWYRNGSTIPQFRILYVKSSQDVDDTTLELAMTESLNESLGNGSSGVFYDVLNAPVTLVSLSIVEVQTSTQLTTTSSTVTSNRAVNVSTTVTDSGTQELMTTSTNTSLSADTTATTTTYQANTTALNNVSSLATTSVISTSTTVSKSSTQRMTSRMTTSTSLVTTELSDTELTSPGESTTWRPLPTERSLFHYWAQWRTTVLNQISQPSYPVSLSASEASITGCCTLSVCDLLRRACWSTSLANSSTSFCSELVLFISTGGKLIATSGLF